MSLLKRTQFLKLVKVIKSELETKKDQSVAHRWDHILRVVKNCIEIAKWYSNIDYDALLLAALLHDIEQPYYEKKSHAYLSAKKAKLILSNLGFSTDLINKVTKIILEHSSENPDESPSSIEAKILFDADKIDGLGAVGIARVFTYCGQNGMSPVDALKWYIRKIKLAEPQLQTDVGRKIAKEKIRYVYNFFKLFEIENSVSLDQIMVLLEEDQE